MKRNHYFKIHKNKRPRRLRSNEWHAVNVIFRLAVSAIETARSLNKLQKQMARIQCGALEYPVLPNEGVKVIGSIKFQSAAWKPGAFLFSGQSAQREIVLDPHGSIKKLDSAARQLSDHCRNHGLFPPEKLPCNHYFLDRLDDLKQSENTKTV